MNHKTFGSMLMILGTCVGAGMLALPVITSGQSIWMSLLVLVASWLIMTLGAFALLEVNLSLPANSNLITMSKATLGTWGRTLTWLVYLILLYSLICAYLSGTSDLFQALIADLDWHIHRGLASVLSMLILLAIVYRGIGSVDIVNRILMSVKALAYVALVVTLMPHIQVSHLMEGNYQWKNSVFMVMLTAFGYAIIIPSLRDYLDSDKKTLKKVVLIGSLIPLVLYTLWIIAVQGLLPRTGELGLGGMINSSTTNSDLMNSLTITIQTVWIDMIAKLFISICAVTSFLGVSVSLVDFVADGLQIKKKSKQGIWVYIISFLPPLLIVLIDPGVFITALAYAGVWCIVLLIVLPLLMLYSGRHHGKFADDHIIPGGRWVLLLGLAISILLLLYQFFV